MAQRSAANSESTATSTAAADPESLVVRADESSRTRFTIDIGDVDGLWSTDSEVSIYRIVQEGLTNARKHTPHDWEKLEFFEGCMPIEEIARRGYDTPRFGPMKPVGLEPPDGSRPHAVVQLRQEDLTLKKARELMAAIMAGQLGEAQLAAVLTALRIKGETVDEIAGLYNQFWNSCRGILKQEDDRRLAQLHLSLVTRHVIRVVFELIGVDAPDKMEKRDQ